MPGPYQYRVGDRILTTEAELRECFRAELARNVTYTRVARTVDLVTGGGRWLDVGCGAGTVSWLISPKVDSVLGIDLHDESLQIANDLFSAQNTTYRNGNLFELAFPDNSFDGVLFLEVIEHVNEPFRFLSEIHRILKPGGSLVISTPNGLSAQQIASSAAWFTRRRLERNTERVFTDAYDYTTNSGHIYSWSHETLARLLRVAGFTYDAVVSAQFLPIEVGMKGMVARFFGREEMRWAEPLMRPLCGTILMRVRKPPATEGR